MEETYNLGVWAEKQNNEYRHRNMTQGFTVDIALGQEHGINMGNEKALTAYYTVSHPEYGELSQVWIVFTKDRQDKDSLAEVAREWIPKMEELLNKDLTDKL